MAGGKESQRSEKKGELESDAERRRADGVGTEMLRAKELGLVKNNQRCLKGRSPVSRGGRQTRLASHSVITTALLGDLRRRSKEMDMERQGENREQKNSGC